MNLRSFFLPSTHTQPYRHRPKLYRSPLVFLLVQLPPHSSSFPAATLVSLKHGPHYSAAPNPVLGHPLAASTRARDSQLHPCTYEKVLTSFPCPSSAHPLTSQFTFYLPLFCVHTRQMGVALGLVVLLVLSAYPGEPFDYSKSDGGRAERQATMVGKCNEEDLQEEEDGDKVEVRVAADGCGSTMDSSSSSSSDSISSMAATTTMLTTTVRHRRSQTFSKNKSKSIRARNGSSSSSGSDDDGQAGGHAKAEALHRLLVHEDRLWQRLQQLPVTLLGALGLSEDGVRLAVRRSGGQTAGKRSSSSGREKMLVKTIREGAIYYACVVK